MRPEGIKPETAKEWWKVVPSNGARAHGEAFRANRVAARLELEDVTRLTGLRGRDVLALESGRVRFVDEQTLKAWVRFLLSRCEDAECLEAARAGGLCEKHRKKAARNKST